MALVTGFLKQRCGWVSRSREGADAFGVPSSEPVTIKCRWEYKHSWAAALMGDAPSYSSKVLVDSPVIEGDLLIYDGRSLRVTSVETIVDAAGKEQGRICYA